MRQDWRLVQLLGGCRLSVVLDPCGESESDWLSVQDAAFRLAKEWASDARLSWYFLADNHELSTADWPSLRAKHIRRTRLITPTWETLEASDCPVLLIAPKLPYDWSDWSDSSNAARLQWLDPRSARLDEIRQKCIVRPQTVQIRGPGWMPFFWDNHVYQWDGHSLTATTAAQWDVVIGGLTPAEAPSAEILWTDGRKQTLSLAEVAEPASPPPRELSKASAEVIRHSLKTRRFECPVCFDEHSAGTWICPEEGKSVVPELSGSGFAVFQVIGSRVRMQFHSGPHWLSGERIAVRDPQGARWFAYSEARQTWLEQERLASFQAISETTSLAVV